MSDQFTGNGPRPRSVETLAAELRAVEAEVSRLAALVEAREGTIRTLGAQLHDAAAEVEYLRALVDELAIAAAAAPPRVFRTKPRPWQPAPADCCGMSGDCAHARQCRGQT